MASLEKLTDRGERVVISFNFCVEQEKLSRGESETQTELKLGIRGQRRDGTF